MFYEIVYETGNHSIAQYHDDEEAAKALTEHHRRAKNGELGGPPGTKHPAERVARVFVYNYHPADHGAGQEKSPADVTKAVNDAIAANLVDGTVQVHEIAAAVRDLSNPTVPNKAHPHDSNYKAPESRELSNVVWGD